MRRECDFKKLVRLLFGFAEKAVPAASNYHFRVPYLHRQVLIQGWYGLLRCITPCGGNLECVLP